jgi:predicted nucleotidyltransferase
MPKTLRKLDFRELNAYDKVLNWFFSFPNKEMSLNGLSEKLQISKATANRIVHQLAKEEFLKIEVLGKIWRISCNQKHHYNLTRKIGHNLIMIYDARIIEEIYKVIKNSRAIMLFGSYRKGDDTEKSDIDIAVEIIDNKDIQIIELGVIPKLGYRNNVTVNLHVFSRKKIDLNLFSNIANGIVLEGFLEVRP